MPGGIVDGAIKNFDVLTVSHGCARQICHQKEQDKKKDTGKSVSF
jgi:hypothetical protein